MTIRGLLAVTQPPTHTITLNGPLKCRFDDQKSFRTKSKATPDLSPSIRPVVVVVYCPRSSPSSVSSSTPAGRLYIQITFITLHCQCQSYNRTHYDRVTLLSCCSFCYSSVSILSPSTETPRQDRRRKGSESFQSAEITEASYCRLDVWDHIYWKQIVKA